jgi:hypothetical protein
LAGCAAATVPIASSSKARIRFMRLRLCPRES